MHETTWQKTAKTLLENSCIFKLKTQMELIIKIGFCLAAFFVAFIICLQIIYWWFRIGPRIKMQEETNRLLKKIAGEQ